MKSVRNPEGYYEIFPKPSIKELDKFYNECLLGCSRPVKKEYSKEELFYLEIASRELHYLYKSRQKKKAGDFLDLGCGEGFFLNYFNQQDFEVVGADFTTKAVETQFPNLVDKVLKGNLFDSIQALISQKRTFDIISCNHVLEHVTDPLVLMDGCRKLLKPDGVFRVSVPNDYSILQMDAVAKGYAEDEFWLSPPSHLTYFNAENFSVFLEKNGFNIFDLLADFPIEFFAYNESSNYLKSDELGRGVHKARVQIESLLSRDSIKPLMDFRRGCASAGIGRSLVA